MSQRRSTLDAPVDTDPTVVGRRATRAGLALAAATLPLVVGTVAGMLVDAPTLTAGVDAVLAAAGTPLVGGYGRAWLFHVGALGLLAGCWLLGAGLLLDGLFD
ncbi:MULTISPECIES: hypothetical protein [Haloarcula]|uniref:Uncharacterized protein n=1 Tax=Haloarcula pellucida TaxID=1427151 RepID=A0A830GPY2_9EURY|nr:MULTISPECIES: hypothetical protein [Halomicroarcula]MBX0348295.1 hypothetical protein [Halomicroarcula pellucida]MDS0278120.1 hypothetical protein [Halomicroarcula sp. S1AR25-4]GGN97885.1 hypothetical protein GCM10009030_27640 [Halomicroarcula pellucida]